jgi:hypothetical protein
MSRIVRFHGLDHWSQSIGGLLGLSVQTPIGAAMDETPAS